MLKCVALLYPVNSNRIAEALLYAGTPIKGERGVRGVILWGESGISIIQGGNICMKHTSIQHSILWPPRATIVHGSAQLAEALL